ncbi:MAG: AIR synthase-related protein, partial [Acidimicrobiales bacterium]
GNPEHPEVMWQLSEAIDGLAGACDALGLPVIGGNVSLYNESDGADIDPTPVLGVLGLLDELVAPPPGWSWRLGDAVVLVGARAAAGDSDFPLGGSRWATRRERRGGRLGSLDVAQLSRTVAFVAGEVASVCAGAPGDLSAVHDVSGGGLGVALAEVAAASGVGARVTGVSEHAELFTETPGRFVVATSDATALLARAGAAGVPAQAVGTVGGASLVVGELVDVAVDDIVRRRSGALPVMLEL